MRSLRTLTNKFQFAGLLSKADKHKNEFDIKECAYQPSSKETSLLPAVGNVFAFEKQKEEPTSDGLLSLSGRGDTVVSSSNQRLPHGGGKIKQKNSREMDTQKALERQVEILKERVEYWKEQTRTRKNIGKKADAAAGLQLGEFTW